MVVSPGQGASLDVPVSSVCFVSPSVGYVADQRGSIYETSDGGSTWSQAYSTTLPSTYSQVWTDLSCDGGSVAEGIRVVEPTLPNEDFLVVAGTGTPVASWSPLASSAAGGPSLVRPRQPQTDSRRLARSCQRKERQPLSDFRRRDWRSA
jgi:hypothetical protein